ncbi:carbon storage regulator CsrA [Microbacterium sp. NPDC056044]|uniref:carbon storage regulator CsrA n=1 Tax=Microbacterium sp. NPDC056044 TaxID=3345690 RepID=UPI0035E08047
MLVLTRKVGESVLIGGEIEVTLLDIKGDSVRIGVKAPRDTRIQRAEIVEAVGRENSSAAGAGGDAEQAILDAVARSRAAGRD